MAWVDPAAALFVGSTPSSKVHQKPSPPAPGDRAAGSGHQQASYSSSELDESRLGQQYAPVWDSSLFMPSPSPRASKHLVHQHPVTSTSTTPGELLGHPHDYHHDYHHDHHGPSISTSTPPRAIIDIDFRRHRHSGGASSSGRGRAGSSGLVGGGGSGGGHDEEGDGESNGDSDSDDVNVMTPTRRLAGGGSSSSSARGELRTTETSCGVAVGCAYEKEGHVIGLPF